MAPEIRAIIITVSDQLLVVVGAYKWSTPELQLELIPGPISASVYRSDCVKRTWDQCTTVYTVYGNCGDDWSFRSRAAGQQNYKLAGGKRQASSSKLVDKRQAS